MSKSVPSQSKSNPRRCVRDFFSQGLKIKLKSFLSIFETSAKSKKIIYFYLICLSAVFAKFMNETMPRFKMRGARPFFHKIQSYVSIYADRKTHFLSTRERLVKSSPNFTYFVDCRRIHFSDDWLFWVLIVSLR